MASHASVENFLRVLCAHLGLERNAVLVHASGVVKHGQGFVFFGPSGSGKTTTARLSASHTILSDDMVLLKRVNGGVRAYGVPFRGDLPETPRSNVNVELAGLFCLRQDEQHFVAPLERPRALAKLVSCVPFVMTSPEMSQRVMALCDDMVAHVPTRELHFRRDSGFWTVVEASVVKGSPLADG
jgi:ABC-type cobalamin/Fe3+-siderophores transport system ATPase subunit